MVAIYVYIIHCTRYPIFKMIKKYYYFLFVISLTCKVLGDYGSQDIVYIDFKDNSKSPVLKLPEFV